MTELATTNQFLRPLTEDDLAQVLTWRNNADIRRYMYTQHEITDEEHRHWFERAQSNPGLHLLIFESKGIAAGFVQFSQLKNSPIADWGFYTAPDSPKGTGRLLGSAALHHAFQQLKLHKVCGQALAYNEPSINFHLALGFQQEGRLRDQHFDGHAFHDLLCFGRLCSEHVKQEG